MDHVGFITHRSRQILLMDATNCSAEELIELLTEVQRIVTVQPATRCSPWATSRAQSSAAMPSLE